MIKVTNLHKSFSMGSYELPVLKGINLEIRRGELVAIVGASGAGKSTLLHIIGTLDKPTEGTVTFDGQDLFRMTEHSRRNFGIGGSDSYFSSITCLPSSPRWRMPPCRRSCSVARPAAVRAGSHNPSDGSRVGASPSSQARGVVGR